VGQVQRVDVRGAREPGRLSGCQMPPLRRLIDIALEEGGSDDQRIGVPNDLEQLVGTGGITDHDQSAAPPRRPQNLIRRNPAAVRQDDLLTREQSAPLWPGGNVERGESLRQHARTRLLFKDEAEGLGTSVRHRKCPHAQMVILDDGARPEHDGSDLEPGPSIWPDHFGQQTPHGAER
jgi:hypothetical protein